MSVHDPEVRMHAGADWLERQIKHPLSALGRAAANLLGDVYLGIYHIAGPALYRAAWTDRDCVQVSLYGELATVDGCELTALVVLAHDRMLRVAISGVGPGYLRVSISKRTCREGPFHARHPDLETHAQRIRDYFAGKSRKSARDVQDPEPSPQTKANQWVADGNEVIP